MDGSEDCLYLNVSVPAGAASTARLPVMVHLHGGSNWFFHPYQHASALVEHGVIVVTVAYRLGVFGFVGHPALSAEAAGSSGEYGVLDQIAALHWVQDNIGAFGGDPRNVTLFGESAGSFDAVAIAASPLGHGSFAKLAAQTESCCLRHPSNSSPPNRTPCRSWSGRIVRRLPSSSSRTSTPVIRTRPRIERGTATLSSAHRTAPGPASSTS